MAKPSTIIATSVSEMTEIVAGLTTKGIAFEVTGGGNHWEIKITGF
jgi:hypothetical protein